LSLLQSEQIAKDKSYKVRQLSIEERKFSIEECKVQAESEQEEQKMGRTRADNQNRKVQG